MIYLVYLMALVIIIIEFQQWIRTSPAVKKQYSMTTSNWRGKLGWERERERESMSSNEGSVKQYLWNGVSQAFPLIILLDNFPPDNAL